MKGLLLPVMLLMYFTASSQEFLKAEYFFDTDPGIGNGTSIALGPNAEPLVFSASISTGSLSPGFHFLAIRVQQADGLWSPYEIRGFYISTLTGNASAVTAAEYFIDTDPGAGNGSPISITSGDVTSFAVPVPAGNLAPGFHFLAIRTRDADGTWGPYESRGFYINAAATNTPDIIAAEYFFDTDPGAGNGTSIAVTPGPNPSFTIPLPATSLLPGFHTLTIRTKNADGTWGLYESSGFYISTATEDAPDIVAAEYFFNDDDPGEGNATSLPVITPASTVNETFIISVPDSLTLGDHTFSIRVMDADGRWSFLETRDITITDNLSPIAEAGEDQNITLPTTTATLDGSASNDPDGTIASFSWTKISGPATGTIVNPDQAVTDVTDLSPGIYVFELTVTDDGTAADKDTVRIAVNASIDDCPPVPLITQTLRELECDVTGVTYQWFYNDNVVTGATNQSFEISVLEYGVYAVEVTANGCTRRSEDFVYLITETTLNAETLTIYPNPVNNQLIIEANQTSMIIITDMLGRKVLQQKISIGVNEIEIQKVSSGMYYIIVNERLRYKIQKM